MFVHCPANSSITIDVGRFCSYVPTGPIKEKAGDFMIAKGIAKLKENGVIDQRLFDWAEALRKERNIGAHASEHDVTAEDAHDVIDFTIAIFDYVYTLSDKYEKYLARKNRKTSKNG